MRTGQFAKKGSISGPFGLQRESHVAFYAVSPDQIIIIKLNRNREKSFLLYCSDDYNSCLKRFPDRVNIVVL